MLEHPCNGERQAYIDKVRNLLAEKHISSPKAFFHTYGCQGNVADSERVKGLINLMGYEFCGSAEEADLVVFNTCAVREHAEDRVFGNVGALKPVKEKRPGMVIALFGCMTRQEHILERIKKSFPFVNIVFGTNSHGRFPELLYRALTGEKRVYMAANEEGSDIDESLPVYRDHGFKAFLPVMYGCDNFCSYCVVPYVRGRERSRRPEEVLREARELAASGVKEITLLGQNVNSYGKSFPRGMNFSYLLREINNIEGEFIIRFMTSHPKDCSKELLDTMAGCEKAAKHLHLPFQSGNSRVLRAMNRGYTGEQYIELIDYARKVMPEISITSDVIVGFPGESYGEFLDTLSLIERLKFTSLFTFIFSPRRGTRAAEMDDPVPYEEKVKWFLEMTSAQERIAAERTAAMNGRAYRALVEERDGEKGKLMGRTEGNVNIFFDGGDDIIGSFQNIEVTGAKNWTLLGRLQ